MAERLRGRAGQKQRKRRLELHPVCAHCLAQEPSIVKATDEIDHIIPLAQGGEDVDDNVQGLCFFHHAIKSAAEDSSREGAATHPDWLKPSRIPITIVCGAPASGKTTYVDKHANSSTDIIIDMDRIARGFNPTFRGVWDKEILNRSMRQRNAMLGSLQYATQGRAWFIVGAPTARERLWWAVKLGSDQSNKPAAVGSSLVFLDVSKDECLRRARIRKSPARDVERYFKASSSIWTPPKPSRKKQAVDADGYPVE